MSGGDHGLHRGLSSRTLTFDLAESLVGESEGKREEKR